LIDAIVPRKEMKSRLIEYLNYLTNGQKQAAIEARRG
jgi:acetyl-CoA carboxylase beta subunit